MNLDERTGEALRVVAGGDGKVSSWVAGVVRERLLADACAAAAAYDADHDDPEFELARLENRA